MSSNDLESLRATSSAPSRSTTSSPALSAAAFSPPLRLVDPSDEPLALALVDRAQAQKDKPTRKVPCLACRSIRRVCKWVEGTNECERCLKQGMRCSGPKKRRQLDPKKAAFLLPPKDEEDAPTTVGFSSPTAQWTDQNLCYSLTYHLVETCRNVADMMSFDGIIFGAFTASFDRSLGRIDELEPEQELLASVYMYFGTQFTNHSSIVGTEIVAPSFDSLKQISDITFTSTSIALLRQRPLSVVTNLMLDQVEDFDPSVGTADEAVRRLMLCWMALESLYSDVAGRQHALLGKLAEAGLGMLGSKQLGEEAAGMLNVALQGILRYEIRQSLIFDVSTSISPADHFRVVGPAKLPELYSWPDSVLDFLLDPEPVLLCQSHPEVERALDSFDAYLHHINVSLIYAPESYAVQTAKYCLKALDAYEAHLASELTRILVHPRYSSFPPDLRLKRPDTQIGNLVLYRILALGTLYATQLALLKAEAPTELVEEGRQRIHESLDDIADLALLNKTLFDRQPVGSFFLAVNLTIALEPLCDSYLTEWATSTSSTKRMKLLEVLLFANFCIPQAYKLVEVLEQVSPPKTPQTAPASPMEND